MSSEPSFQDLLADFSEEIFVGRSEQLTLFEQALMAAWPPFLILAISGQGGVGKTTLLERFRCLAEERQALTALVNEDQATVPEVLNTLAEQLGKDGGAFKDFKERYRKYRELKEELEADPKAPKGILDFALRSAARIGIRSLRRVPLAGEAAEILLTPETEDRIAEETSALAQYVAQKFTNKDERVLLLETDQELSREFVIELNKLAVSKRLILFFDTYEKTAPVLDSWLRDLIEGKFGQFSGRVSFVIAGRYPLGQLWMKFRRATRQVELQEFTEAEAQDYLRRAGITDEAEVKQLMRLSNRLPVLLALLVSAPGDAPGDVSGTAVERFLRGTTPEQREAALVGSAPRFFNRDVLEVILGEEAAAAAFAWLSEAEFVRAGTSGWAYHDVVRTMMMRHFRLRSAQQCTEVHRKLAVYYRTQEEKLALSENVCRLNKTWQNYELERLYHHLSENPAKHLEEVLKGFLAALLGDMIRDADDDTTLTTFSTILELVSHETKEEIVKTWSDRFTRMVAVFTEGESSEVDQRVVLELFTILSKLTALEADERSVALMVCGLIELVGQKPQQALNFISQAIELFPGNSLYYRFRGSIQQELKDYSAALEDFDQAIELAPEDAEPLLERAQVYQQMGKYKEALADFSRVIELDPEGAWAITERAQVYRQIGKYEEALTDFDRAIELVPEDAWVILQRAHMYWQIGKYEEALIDFDRAIELAPEDTRVILQRAHTYWRMGKYDQALKDHDQAIELAPEDAWVITQRARMYRQIGKYEEALKDHDRAIELAPEDTRVITERGQTYRQIGKYEEALTDFDRAIELAPEDAWVITQRARMYRQIGKYEEALKDHDRAIELVPEAAWVIIERGQTYRQIGKYEEALTDFDRAIELKPEYVWVIAYDRGETYRQMGKYEEALKDFDRAIDLNAKFTRSIARRGQAYGLMERYEEALKDFDRAIELAAEKVEFLYHRVVTLVRWKGLVTVEAQMAEVRAALLASPDKEPSDKLYREGGLAALQGDFLQALKYLEEAITIDKEFMEEARFDIAWLDLRDDPCFQELVGKTTWDDRSSS